MLTKTKLNSIEVGISKALIDSDVSLDELVPVNNVLKEYIDTKKSIKNHRSMVDTMKKHQHEVNFSWRKYKTFTNVNAIKTWNRLLSVK